MGTLALQRVRADGREGRRGESTREAEAPSDKKELLAAV